MAQTTDEHALTGMLDEYEELSNRLTGVDFPNPDGAALRELVQERMDTLWGCIEDHHADMDRRANQEDLCER